MKKGTRKHIIAAGWILFAVYLAVLVYLLFFADYYGRTASESYRINMLPFREIRRFLGSRDILGNRAVFLNVYGNILLFIPFGAILPVLGRRAGRFLPVIFSGMMFSLCVEAVQLVTRRGSCDIDDVILNTAGAAAGYAVFALCRSVYRRLQYGRKKKIQI